MVKLSSLRRELDLPPATDDEDILTLGRAAAVLSPIPAARWRPVYTRLLAQELRPHLAALAEVLTDIRTELSGGQAEQRLVAWLAGVTGGQAIIRSSWGDVVAQHGVAQHDVGQHGPSGVVQMDAQLDYAGRLVGSLHLEADPDWHPLFELVGEFVRLARLQAAAAGAARRRVGERQFESLLAGDATGAVQGGPCILAALRLSMPLPRPERAREAHIHKLDVLCSVGEGYLQGRSLSCLSTVRGDKALWLWPSRSPERDARGLHAALLNATDQDVRLGLSSPQPSYGEVDVALRQALQALGEVPGPRGMMAFHRLDPLQALYGSQALQALAEQVRGRLQAADPEGKLEDTLRHYLEHRRSLAELARHLHLHVNTLRYRLRRIEDVLGGELSEPAFVARLYLAFHASRAPSDRQRAPPT